MNGFDWRCFLMQWSTQAIDATANREDLPPEVIKSGWLGYPGASEEQIRQAEERLQVSLPPSYKAFLKVTNGWRQTTPFIYKIWSVEEIKWFSTEHQTWINEFVAANAERQKIRDARGNGAATYTMISDQDYLVYSTRQDCSKLRIEYLKTALAISERGESSIYLLNPQVVTSTGEWEAWFFGDWLPGADRYRSFQEMMQAEYQNFLELLNV
ncbi:MAG: SMI1/KNR4 family protein [Cyanobacteria bacterium J06648_16]